MGSSTSTLSRKTRRSSTLHKVARKVELRSIFQAPSRKYKILAIPNILDHRKSYEYGFVKKCDGYKLYTKSCFDRFFVHRLGNSKYWSFPMN
ncbi:hypothetical protein GW17_00004255 [Ensete ventricosum]|nr:hypothetical protein GW17_00004255 [Ensete ventricosum]